MRRALVAALALAGTAACSYIFDLPSSSVAPTDPDGVGEGGLGGDERPPYVPPPPVPFCETQPAPFLYCADFDDEPAPDLASIGSAQERDGRVSFSSAVALSPPRSLLMVARGANASAALTRDLATAPEAVSLSFDLLVSAWTTDLAEMSELVFGDPAAQCSVRLGGTASTWTLTQVCTAGGTEVARVTNDSPSSIVHGGWQRFRIGVVFAPAKTVFLEIDDTRVLEVPGAAPMQQAPTSIGLGIKGVPDGSVTLFQDNVLVTSP